MMRLLVFTPTYTLPNGADAISPECPASVRAQRPDCEFTYEIGHYNPFPGASLRNVLAQYQQAHAMCLNEGYDALLTVEHDNVLPDDGAFQRMLDTAGDIVYAPYLLRHGMVVLSTWQYIGNRNLGMSLSRYPYELEQARKALAWRVSGIGMGCTLFRRHVLERIPFRQGEGEQYAPDLPFAQDALAAGFVSMGRFDVPVLHKQNSVWLHPYEAVGMKRYYCRVTVNAITPDGTRFNLVQGTYVEMLPDQAYDLARAGFITIPDEQVETATAEPAAELAVLPQARRRKGASHAAA